MADGYRRVEETVKAFERKMASEIAHLVAEETRPLRAALEASKSECEALRKRAAELEACIASRLRPGEEQSAIPGLPDDLVVAHILGSANLSDPTDVARLTAVSRGMCAAVAATKRADSATKVITVKKPEEGEAVKKGYLSTLKHMHSRGRLSRKKYMCEEAALGGNLDVLKLARKNGCPWDAVTCSYAAAKGHLEVLKWARNNGCPWDALTCARAAEHGHLETLKWARANGCPWSAYTCACAAEGGHLEMLKWARENDCPWDEGTCAGAAYLGHLDVLKWARANGCPWDEWTCERAAEHGHLEALQWARANGCPWDENTRQIATEDWPEVFA